MNWDSSTQCASTDIWLNQAEGTSHVLERNEWTSQGESHQSWPFIPDQEMPIAIQGIALDMVSVAQQLGLFINCNVLHHVEQLDIVELIEQYNSLDLPSFSRPPQTWDLSRTGAGRCCGCAFGYL